MARRGGPRGPSQPEVCEAIAARTGLSSKDVAAVFAALPDLIGEALGEQGPGRFSLAGLVELKVVRRPALPARQGVNPFTREPITIKARPEVRLIKIQALKALKDLV